MSRFKFRVWHKKANRFVKDDDFEGIGITLDGDFGWASQSTFGSYRYGTRPPLDKNDDFPIQQFTGLTDANNQEIYEGDILTNNFVNPENQIVIYENGKFTVTNITIGCNDLFDEISQSAGHRIIGNIFENPELL